VLRQRKRSARREAAETESIYAKLKVAQVETRLQGAQKELAVLAEPSGNISAGAFDTAECELKTQMAKKEISAGLRSISFGKSWVE
jgi:hypothetical protein